MAGQPVTLSTPYATTDTAINVVAKLNTDFGTLATELARKVTPSDLNLTGTIYLNGAQLADVGYATFVDAGLSPAVPGSFYYSAGEWYMVTSAGAIKITNLGAVNIGGSGGITGDYPGATGANVNYTHSTKQYDFIDAPGVYAYLRADRVILGSTANTLTFVFGGSTTGTWSFPNLPASGRNLVSVNASGTVAVDNIIDGAVVLNGASAITTAALTVSGAATLTGGFTAAADQKHTDSWTYQGSVVNSYRTGTISVTGPQKLDTAAGSWTASYVIQGLRVGDKITSVSMVIGKASAGTFNLTLNKQSNAGAPAAVLTGTAVFTGTGTATCATGTPAAIASGEDWYLTVGGTSTSPDTLYSPKFTVTHP